MQYIHINEADDGPYSCVSCIIGKARRKPFVSMSRKIYAPHDTVSSDTIELTSQADVESNK